MHCLHYPKHRQHPASCAAGRHGAPKYARVNRRHYFTAARLGRWSCQAAAPGSAAQDTCPVNVMISGAPAAGKGTQCARVVEKYNLVHISAGDLLRAEVAADTPAGRTAKRYMDQGQLVPNEVIVTIIKGRVGQADAQAQGWLLDGYPRSASQAEAIVREGIRPDVFILIEVPDGLLVERVVGRRQDPATGEIYHLKHRPPPPDVVHRLVHRKDDTEELVKKRLETHNKNVSDVLGFYEDVIVRVKGDQSMEEVFQCICKIIDEAILSIQDEKRSSLLVESSG